MNRLGKRLLVVPALLLGLAGCDGTRSTPAAPAVFTAPLPVLLQVSASRPAGTLDSLPDLSWSLAGPTGLSLVFRAQGPGTSAPGLGFAGARVASGPVRYLAADGTWSEAEVTYAMAAGAAGVLHPTAPLRIEGEWRFDLLVKDADGGLRAVATAPVLLSAAPGLRVSLSTRAAVNGDTVEGSVILARGSAARPVKLLAWWQGPAGRVIRLPEGGGLAFDGPSADDLLPLLVRRLDGAAPGRWTLVARLFDGATGAPLGYGEQTLEICGAPAAVSGTLRGSDGALLGAGSTSAQVSAIPLNRPGQRSASVGADGSFSLGLEPGAWLVSASVIDATGLHRVPAQVVRVGCAPAVLALTAASPRAWPVTLGAAAATPSPLRVARAAGQASAAPASPPTCENASGSVHFVLLEAVDPAAARRLGPADVETWADVVSVEVAVRTSQLVMVSAQRDLAALANNAALLMAIGENSTVEMRGLASAMGGSVFGVLAVTPHTSTQADPQVDLSLTILDTTGQVIRRASRSAHVLDGATVAVVRALVSDISPGTLLAAVREHSDFPQEPQLTLKADFGSVLPNSQQSVTVHLQDCSGAPGAHRSVELLRSPVPFPRPPFASSDYVAVHESTDAAGDARFSVMLGASDLKETISARYRKWDGSRYGSNEHTYAVQRAQAGEMQFAPTVPVVRPGGSAVLQLTSRDPLTGAPQPAKPIAFSADLGGVRPTATAVTDAIGVATVTLPAGATIGLGRVEAVGSTQVPPPPDAGHATENLVVSSPVALNLSGPTATVPTGSVVELSGSLLLDGLPMPGTTVTLTSAGTGGALSTATVAVDDTGTFAATFIPPTSGSAAATVTASVQVEGQAVTRDVAISWTGQERGDRLISLATNDGLGGVTLSIQKVEQLARTELFNVVRPPIAAGTPPPFFSPRFYLRQQNRMVGEASSGSAVGWGFLDATGLVTIASPPLPDTIDVPSAVSSNGKYRAHSYGYEYCDPSLPEGSPCTVTKAVVVYDNATGAVLDQLDPRLSGPSGLAAASAVGPAGELLMGGLVINGSPTSITWYLHRPGGATTAIGTFPVGDAKFGASGDKVYIGDPSNLVEVVLATGASRSLPAFGTPAVAAMSWTVELDGLLYVDTADPEPRQLHRLDLASGQVTEVGTLPPSPSSASSITLVP